MLCDYKSIHYFKYLVDSFVYSIGLTLLYVLVESSICITNVFRLENHKEILY